MRTYYLFIIKDEYFKLYKKNTYILYRTLENLFKLINTHLEQRKELFLNYAGSINEYKKATGNKIPAIIIMINGFDSFSELYPDYVENLIKRKRS